MPLADLTASTQTYLKVIWSLQEWSAEPVTASMIATRTGFRRSSVSGAIYKLAEQGLVEHAPYGAVVLTDDGRSNAVAMVRRHRLLETFLVQVLGYTWDEVHDEADTLEHAVSDRLMDHIDHMLGHPTRDPHGDPIPTVDGDLPASTALLLTHARPGRKLTVERISDKTPDLLRHFANHGIVVGATLDIQPGAPYSGVLEVTVDGSAPVPLGPTATDSVWVVEAD